MAAFVARYFDTSVVAYYLPEEKSATVQSMYKEADVSEINALVALELSAASSLRLRIGDLGREEAEEVTALFDYHMQDGLYGRRSLNPRHWRLDRDYVARFDLPPKSADALHPALCAAEDLTLPTASSPATPEPSACERNWSVSNLKLDGS